MLFLLIMLLLMFIGLPLYLTARFLDEDEGMGPAIGTTILMVLTYVGILWFIPFPPFNLLLAIIINLLLIKGTYDTSWGKALAMWVITIIMAVVILILMAILFGLSLLVL